MGASKPHLPHKSLSWMRFVTFCCGGMAKGVAVRALDNTFEHARVSEKRKRSVRPDTTLTHAVISFCCGGPQKLFAVRRPINTIKPARRTDNLIIRIPSRH